MKRFPILEVCARVDGHELQHRLLRLLCQDFGEWDEMLAQAEREGMSPLLRKHLLESGSEFPAAVRRSLHLLYKRHEKMARVRIRVIEELFLLFKQHRLVPILIKGAALCQSLYRDPALRPMRDIDILFHHAEVDAAQDLLRRAGFSQLTTAIPPDHHHLPSLHKMVDGVEVCVELHRGLYPNITPHYPDVDFSQLLTTGKTIHIGNAEVTIFNHEETLHYLFQHGFRSPLTYETFKLINAADIISFVELYFQQIDWQQIARRFPELYRALPLMHHISPWDAARVSGSFASERMHKRRLQPIPFNGWPHRRRRELRRERVLLVNILKETFVPSGWWLRLYYGAGYSVYRYVKALFIDHPVNVFRWAHLFYRLSR